MNLKDAFRVQNKLQQLMAEASTILEDKRNIMKVQTTHLRSKVMAEAQDETVADSRPSEYAGHANEIAAFLMAMLEEREKLACAIHAAKSRLAIDMDTQTGLNRARQQLAETFRTMTVLRSEEKIIANGGTGYRFNGEGNQVSYRCDARQVKTIDFDRNKIRGMAAALSRKSDEISAQLDQCLVNTTVEYEPPFDLNDSFDEILSDFIEKAASGARASS